MVFGKEYIIILRNDFYHVIIIYNIILFKNHLRNYYYHPRKLIIVIVYRNSLRDQKGKCFTRGRQTIDLNEAALHNI